MFRIGELVHFVDAKGNRHKSVARVTARNVQDDTYTLDYTSRGKAYTVTVKGMHIISRRSGAGY